MQQPMQPIIQHLFQVSSLEDLSRQQIEAFVEQYPAFGIGHYLLSRKLKTEDAERYSAETQKTSLYFSNPFWLQWQLDNVAAGNGVKAEPVFSAPVLAEPVVTAPVATGPIATSPEVLAAPVEVAPVEVSRAVVEEREVVPEEPVEVHEPVAAEPEVVAHEAPAAVEALVVAGEPEVVEAPAAVANVVTVAEESFELPTTGDNLAEALSRPVVETPAEASAADRLLRSIEEARGLRESLHKINEDFVIDDFSVETGVAGETVGEDLAPAVVEPAAAVESVVEAPIKDEEVPFVLEEADESLVAVEEPVVMPEVEVAAPEQEIAAPAAAGEPMLFEPYHTIDYFASQGIKLTLEENPSDALGKQLKSFTEWLKSMRRLPRKDREVVPDRVAEEAVQTSAQHSIQGKDVLTETMAEVLAKQGMRERARAVYEKLSLLNPDKSAYFATKIEQLNIP